MTLLSLNYLVLSISGLWRPASWPQWAGHLYHLYTLVMLINIVLFLISGITSILSSTIKLDLILFDSLSLIFTLIPIVMKIYCLVYSRDAIIAIDNRLEEKLLKLDDHQEQMVYQYYCRISKNITHYYTGLFIIAINWFIYARTTLMVPPEILPFQGWFPYNYSSPRNYKITAVYQLFAIFNASVTNMSFDPLLPCIFYYVCAHIRILKLRFNSLLKKLETFNINDNDILIKKLQVEQQLISEWVDYHIEILSWADMINVTFSKVAFAQYSFSSLILCLLAYLTSHTPIGSVDFIRNIIFFGVMYIQIYAQCSAADHMTYEFADVAIEVGTAKWFNLSCHAQKYMVIILAKSMRPVIFTGGFFLSLSLESFMKVIKLAYTIYNLLE